MAARGNRLAKCSKRLSPTPKSSCVRANAYRGALDATVLLYRVPTTITLSQENAKGIFRARPKVPATDLGRGYAMLSSARWMPFLAEWVHVCAGRVFNGVVI